jgi:sigma-B regulation protein RsbU (phosphoserine phosphatase)
LRLNGAGRVTWLDLPKGSVLGISQAPAYTSRLLRLNPGDTLLCYTDGVNEAMDPAKNLFGDQRLYALAATQAGATPKQLVEALFAAVHQFAHGEEPSDDITILALQFRGEDSPKEFAP